MKILIWILVIWIIVSLIYGTAKEGTSWMAPYIDRIKRHPIITILIFIVILLILF